MSEVGATLSLTAYAERKNETQAGHHHRDRETMTNETIVIKGTPIAKARPRFTKTGRTYTPAQTKQAEQAILLAWLGQVGNRAPHTGPVMVRVQFVFTPPASWPKWKRELAEAGRIPHTTKPDTDNLLKILDGLNGHAWIDDAQLINVHGRKDYGPEPLTRIMFTFASPAPTTKPR